MRRTGSQVRAWVVVAVAAAASSPAFAAERPEFHQSADRKEVGTEDTFRLTIVIANAPDGAQLKLPSTDDFETLSKSQSTEMSYQMIGPGPGVIKRVQKWVLVMRANRIGALVVPPSELVTPSGTFKTDPVPITVKKGHLEDPTGAGRPNSPMRLYDPFQSFPFPQDLDDLDEDQPQNVPIPRSDSDLFLRAMLDRDSVYVGEQATLSLYIFSRVDLSSVDTLTMPKLEGFWSEDVDSPSQLSAEQRIVGGVPYHAYLLKRRALFPVKGGTVKIGAAEADVTTGFLFAGRRVHRKGNELSLRVKPLPAAGRPASLSAGNVGVWRMMVEPGTAQVELGQPVTVKVVVEGRGNMRGLAVPPLQVPQGLRLFDPTITDKPLSSRGRMGGRRTLEYLVMPQQTGSFTIPAVEMPFFDPENERYDVARTEPVSVTVTGAAPKVASVPGVAPEGVKNVLQEAQALRPLRYRPSFTTASAPLWERSFFVPALLAPVALWLGVLGAGFVRAAARREDPAGRQRKRARAARARLAAAEQLKGSRNAGAFYGEVEKAVLGFLEARLGEPVGGLTRDELAARMEGSGVPADRVEQVRALLDQCDLGRFAPGAGDGASRDQMLADAMALMEEWPA
ncbi:MAG TPA: BatD family protein [Myxococcales bacterium]|nr:BatD family protein [Myxococcales bacterium]